MTRKASIFVKESVLWKCCQMKPGWVLGDTIKVKGVNDFSFLCAKVYYLEFTFQEFKQSLFFLWQKPSLDMPI